MSTRRNAIILASVMFMTSAAAIYLRPSARDPKAPPSIVLDKVIPSKFGGWREFTQQSVLVVNPQTQELLDKLYSQILTRTYVDADGYRVMVSIAYGDDQRGGLQAHMPEVCYPAQGFKLLSSSEHRIETPFGTILGRRLVTAMGSRNEPVTYWFAYGNTQAQDRWQRRLLEIQMGLSGQVPDGLLLRVSSIDADSDRAFARQEAMIGDLLQSLPASDRSKLTGGI